MNNRRIIPQDELRKYMKKSLGDSKKKIDSPLAKYSSDGQLTCIVCNSIVRSEAVWSVHINSKQHRGNITKKKQIATGAASNTSDILKGSRLPPDLLNPLKRHNPNSPGGPPKKIKGILKNAPKPTTSSSLPADFFEISSLGSKPVVSNSNSNNESNGKSIAEEAMEVDQTNRKGDSETLPEGFFDDPILDAKARNVEYKDPIEEELEKFQKEIKEEQFLSTKIIEEDNEEAINQRQIEEIDEQSQCWSRILKLEKQKEKVDAAQQKPKVKQNNDDSSASEEDFDEFLDWRSKKSFK